MFTGIVEATAPILAKTPEGLTVQRPSGFDAIKEGSSICVSGVCLSVIAFDATSMRFDVIEETWARTKLGGLKEGSRVNLEQALPAAGRFDGNIVQGHVEGVGEVIATGFSSTPQPPPPLEEGGQNFFKPVPLPPNTRHFAREMRKEQTDAESLLWEGIRRDQLGVRIRRQYVLDGCIFDFYCPELKIAIEVDGGVHLTKHAQQNDKERDQHVRESFGVKTIRMKNDDILSDLNSVITRLTGEIQNRKQTYSPPPAEEGLGVEEMGIILSVRIPRELLRYIASKGAITLDGVALTVTTIEADVCCVALIPHTLTHTTIGTLLPGDPVNIETDVLARYAERILHFHS